MRDRGQMAAAEAADLALHPTLLMRPLHAGSTKEGVIAVMGPHRHEPGMFEAFPAQCDSDHRPTSERPKTWRQRSLATNTDFPDTRTLSRANRTQSSTSHAAGNLC